jgi:hypothetical protein
VTPAPVMPFLSTPSFDLSAGAEPTLGQRPAPVPPSLPPATAAAAHPQMSTAAARRLREEERLREAIDELHRNQGGGDGKEAEERHGEWGCGHEGESCAAYAAGNLCQSFLLSYGVRVGIGILLRAFKLARRKSYASLLDLKVFSSPPLQTATLCTAWFSKLQLSVATSLQGYIALSPFFVFEPVEACN